MDLYEINNLKSIHSTMIREHSKLMNDISKLDSKQEVKKTQKEIDLLYKTIIDISKLLNFYKEQE